jgi:hypothetical protein
MENNTESGNRVIYLSWKSPSRLFKKRDKDFFRNVAAIVFLLLVILLFAKEFLLIFAVISVTFLVYVFSTVPPEDIPHNVSNVGIETAGHFYRWQELSEFWFDQQWGQQFIVVVPFAGPRIVMLLGDISESQLKEVLMRFIHFREEPQKTALDSAASWLSQKIPLEKPTDAQSGTPS